MNDAEMDAMLRETAQDRRLSRGERKAVRAVIEQRGLNERELARFRARAFAVAAELAHGGRPTGDLLNWLEETLKALIPSGRTRRAEAHFSPGDDCLRAIVSNIRACRESLDICVFTITDDRISEVIAGAHERGVTVRVISDDDKSLDRGSDIDRLSRLGVDVRVDRTDAHMHHKYAIFDRQLLATGSYNWTRSAATANQENILLTDDGRLVRRYSAEFESLWHRFG